MTWYQILGIVIVGIGLIIQGFGVYGMIAHRDFYVRLSISSLIDSAGFLTIMLGLIFYKGFSITSLKIGFIVFLMLLLNPLSNHILGRGAYMSNYHPERRSK